MREKNYNIELIRTISFILVIVIHVTNYFCRAFGKINMGEYGFALILDTFARVSVPCFFMISGAMLLGRTESDQKLEQTDPVSAAASVLECCILSVQYILYGK